MDSVEILRVLAIAWIVIFAAMIVIFAVEMLVHLIKAPRCPECNDWLEISDGRAGVAYECPGCRGLFSKQEVEAHREYQTSRGG